jgi:signal transduction histidine kinase
MPRATDTPALSRFVASGVHREVAHLTTTGSSRILEADSASARLFERSIGSLVQKPLAALVDMADRVDFRSRLAALSNEQHAYEWPLHVSGPDGRRIPVVAAVQTVPTEGDGAATKLSWTFVRDADTVSTPAPERETPDDREIFEREMAHLVHELNQPLAAITTFVRGIILRLRQDKLTNEDLEPALEALADEARRASSIVRAAGRRWEDPS